VVFMSRKRRETGQYNQSSSDFLTAAGRDYNPYNQRNPPPERSPGSAGRRPLGGRHTQDARAALATLKSAAVNCSLLELLFAS